MDFEDTKSSLKADAETQPAGEPGGKARKSWLVPVLFLSVTSLTAFLSVFLFVGQMRQKQAHAEALKKAAAEAAAEAAAARDTLSAPVFAASEPAARPAEESSEDDSLFPGDTAEKFQRYLALLSSEMNKKRSAQEQLDQVTGERDKLARELDELKQNQNRQAEEIDYFKEKLPDLVAGRLMEMQNTRTAQPAAAGGGDEAPDPDAAARKLAKIYENMRPEHAAPVLAKLGDQDIVDILVKMRQRNAAKVLAAFDPALAARITKRISGN